MSTSLRFESLLPPALPLAASPRYLLPLGLIVSDLVVRFQPRWSAPLRLTVLWLGPAL